MVFLPWPTGLVRVFMLVDLLVAWPSCGVKIFVIGFELLVATWIVVFLVCLCKLMRCIVLSCLMFIFHVLNPVLNILMIYVVALAILKVLLILVMILSLLVT